MLALKSADSTVEMFSLESLVALKRAVGGALKRAGYLRRHEGLVLVYLAGPRRLAFGVGEGVLGWAGADFARLGRDGVPGGV